jgi:hypothetical protein
MIKVLRGVRTVAPMAQLQYRPAPVPGRLPAKALISQNVKLVALLHGSAWWGEQCEDQQDLLNQPPRRFGASVG